MKLSLRLFAAILFFFLMMHGHAEGRGFVAFPDGPAFSPLAENVLATPAGLTLNDLPPSHHDPGRIIAADTLYIGALEFESVLFPGSEKYQSEDSLLSTLTLSAPAPEERPPAQPEMNQLRGKNSIYLELLGKTMNLVSLNLEHEFRRNFYVRAGASYLGYSSKLRYEDRDNDLHVGLFTLPFSVSHAFFGTTRQLEFGLGATYLAFSFNGGPFDVGYFDIELDNYYRGVALTSLIGYRVNVEDYMFRLGLTPLYMFSLAHTITGSLDELEALDVLDFREILHFRGWRFLPGLGFGRTF